MKSSLQPGLTVTRRIEVDGERAVGFLGEDLIVYGTPEMIRDIEWTCRDFMLEHADAGEDSVGIGVNVTHSAATPLGMWVDIEATVSKVKNHLVTFDVVLSDPVEEVGRGTHYRAMVPVDKLRQRLADKTAKAG
jgi:predicted thioesterase